MTGEAQPLFKIDLQTDISMMGCGIRGFELCVRYNRKSMQESRSRKSRTSANAGAGPLVRRLFSGIAKESYYADVAENDGEHCI